MFDFWKILSSEQKWVFAIVLGIAIPFGTCGIILCQFWQRIINLAVAFLR